MPANSTTHQFLNIGNLVGMGNADIHENSADPQFKGGALSFISDALGPRILKYVKNVRGANSAVAELVELAADGANVLSTSITNITAGSTTSATTSSLTAGRHQGMICYVLDNADSAGTAPEGEVSVVANNSATVITMEADYPYSVALAVNDDLELIATYQVETTAANAEAWTCPGFIAGKDGIDNNNWGWLIQEGFVLAKPTAANVGEGDPVEAAANGSIVTVAQGHEEWVGIALAAMTNDSVALRCPILAKLFTYENSGGTP